MTSASVGVSGEVLRDVLELNLRALWSRFGHGEGCTLHGQEEALLFGTPTPTVPYSAVLKFPVTADVERRIHAVINHYRRRGVPFVWPVHPSAQPSDPGKRLKAHGLEGAKVQPGMVMDLSGLPEPAEGPAGMEIREVAASDTDELLGLVAWRREVPEDHVPKWDGVAWAFEIGVPGSAVRCWVVGPDSVPVAKVLLDVASEASGIYGVSTNPELRGSGLARALTLRALHAARGAGTDLGMLHPTADGGEPLREDGLSRGSRRSRSSRRQAPLTSECATREYSWFG